MSSVVPTNEASGGDRHHERISASMVEEAGQRLFQLCFRKEVIPLSDSGALNRWMAVGITGRHSLSIAPDGITIDGRKLEFDMPHAIEELEAILNSARQTTAATPPTHHAIRGESLPPITETGTGGPRFLVSRDGFDFHLTFRTKFGEIKTDRLEAALNAFQNMGLFLPHVSLQKVGIKLVATRWDGESFVEEHGIDNLETASPEDVSALIDGFLQGSRGPAAATAPARADESGKRVARLEIVKKPNEFRFHLIFHRRDGTTEDGPLLIRPNLAKLQTEGMFQPNVVVLMTALNDRVVIERTVQENGKPVKRCDTFPLNTLEDAKKIEEALNACLNVDKSPVPPIPAQPKPPSGTAENSRSSPPKVGESKPETKSAPLLPAQKPSEITPPKSAITKPAPPPVSEPPVPPAPKAAGPALEKPKGEAEHGIPNWMITSLKSIASRPPEEIRDGIFGALQRAADRPQALNEHGFPCITFHSDNPADEWALLEVVLMPHHLLCVYPFGYVRFGSETRVFVKRLDDFISLPHDALRGVAKGLKEGVLKFVVSDDFASFLRAAPARDYKTVLGGAVVSATQLSSEQDLLWPMSREEQLFVLLGESAMAFGLPATSDAIVLDPNHDSFLGFKRTPDHGMEFRLADDSIRFSPESVRWSEDGTAQEIRANGVLAGWALDGEGRVCALFDPASGFSPPVDFNLIRFLPQKAAEADQALNVLASLTPHSSH